MNTLQIISNLQGPCTFRLRIRGQKPIQWSEWIISPSPGYIETAYDGPYAVNQIEALLINPVKEIWQGKLLPVKQENYTDQLTKQLNSNNISFVLENEIVVIAINQF